jgi:hypothetical protein
MSMTPERVAERVAGMIESIRNGGSHSFSEYNVRKALHYVAQVFEMGIIDDVQRNDFETAIRHSWREWKPKPQQGPLFSDEFR